MKTKIFIEINIFNSKNIIVVIDNKTLIIDNCDVILSLSITFKRERVNRIIYLIDLTIISSHTTIIIIVKFRERAFSIDKNYSFYFILNIKLKLNENFFIYIIDINIIVVYVRNVIDQVCVLFKNAKIDKFRDYEKQNYYIAYSKNNYLIVVLIVN